MTGLTADCNGGRRNHPSAEEVIPSMLNRSGSTPLALRQRDEFESSRVVGRDRSNRDSVLNDAGLSGGIESDSVVDHKNRETMSKPRVLIIEDERALAEILTYNLQKEGFEVFVAHDGQDGLKKAEANQPALIVLDLMLPIVDGLEVCRQLRSSPATQAIRVLMLTARSEEVDEIVGFNMGADDYVTKPFKIKPLIHRIKALLRRGANPEPVKDVVSVNGIEIDRLHHLARVNGQDLHLTPTEFRLLWTLARQPNRPFGRNELMDRCRGEDANALERTIDVHVRSLRQKLAEKAELIETVRGIGYRFRADPAEPSTLASSSAAEPE
jgi:two-component system, OmpR family, phosphate regulon response regulator PhoB